MADYILANALSEGLQLLAPLALVTGLGYLQPVGVLWVFACYIAALVAANVRVVLVALMRGS